MSTSQSAVTLCGWGVKAGMVHFTTTATVLQPFFRDHPGELALEENFWTLWCKGRLTDADTPTVRLGATPSGLTSAHLHQTPHGVWFISLVDKSAGGR